MRTTEPGTHRGLPVAAFPACSHPKFHIHMSTLAERPCRKEQLLLSPAQRHTLAPGLGVATCPPNNLWGLDVTGPWSRKAHLSPSTLASGNLRPKSKVSLGVCSPEKLIDHTCQAGFVPWRQQPLGILDVPPSLLPSTNAPARRVALTIIDTE